jgi:hypothetical protein
MRHKQPVAVWVVRGLLRSRLQLPVCRGLPDHMRSRLQLPFAARGLPDQRMIVTRTSNRQVPGHAYEYHGHVYGAGSGRNSDGVLDTLAGFSQGVCCCCSPAQDEANRLPAIHGRDLPYCEVHLLRGHCPGIFNGAPFPKNIYPIHHASFLTSAEI